MTNTIINMDGYLLSIIVFIILLALFLYKDRANIKRESILLLRKTKRGRNSIIRLATRFPRFWKWVGGLGVVTSFVASIYIFWTMLVLTAQNLQAGGMPGIGLVLPSPSSSPIIAPGVFGVPFWYWIISIGLLALVHEVFHGIMAARENMRIKSLGWGIFIVIPLAFVEPDERQVVKKPFWAQQRMFAAGSFANFLLAGLSILLAIGLVNGAMAPQGVAFGGYIGTGITADDIDYVNSIPVSDMYEIRGALEALGEQELVSLAVGGDVYYQRAGEALGMLESGSLAVFEDYPAVKENLTGIITKINGVDIEGALELSEALGLVSAGDIVDITTTTGEFRLEAKAEPEPVFSPGVGDFMAAGMEHVIPGYIGFSNSISRGWAELWGAYNPTWSSLTKEVRFWEWVKKEYPDIRGTAALSISELKISLADYQRGGYIGISYVATKLGMKEGLEPLAAPVEFLEGLLFWMFLINIGVGAFNLLPIRALDGGRMWELVFRKITPRHYKRITGMLSIFMIFIILLNFLLVLAPV
jgi:membrane-associated protease RseP (regulator of RpoE activity)